jgi:hypothetical protein
MANPSKKLFFAGMLAGAIVMPIVLFSAGWIVTSGAAGAAVKQSAQDAIVASLAPICVSQFPQGDGRAGQLAKLKALSQWSRPDYVTQNGWATMPGGDASNGLVASECARRLADLEK